MNNRIAALRKSKGLTQKQLAEKAGTTQQTVQRVEKGLQAPRFDLAVSLCRAMDVSLKEVFPNAEFAEQRLKQNIKRGKHPLEDDATVKALKGAGFDMDTCQWTLRMHLTGGLKMSLKISEREHEWFWESAQDSDKSFHIVNTQGRRFAINAAHLQLWHFLFDRRFPNTAQQADVDTDAEAALPVQVWLIGENEPLTFTVDPDQPGDGDEGVGQMGQMFTFLDLHHKGVDCPVSFIDQDGETVFFNPHHVAAISCPHDIIVDADDGDGADEE